MAKGWEGRTDTTNGQQTTTNNGGINGGEYWSPPPVGGNGGRGMTFHDMRQRMNNAMNGGGEVAAAPPQENFAPPQGERRPFMQPPAGGEQTAGGFLNFRRRFQPQPGGQPPVDRPGQQERQQPERPRLNRGAGDQPQDRGSTRWEFSKQPETSILKDLTLPNRFKQVKIDENEHFMVRAQWETGRSKVTVHDGREISADQNKILQDVLKTQGKIGENHKNYDDLNAMVLSGTASFYNNPTLSVEKAGGRNVLVVRDEDQKQGLTGYTMYIPSDKGQFLYAVTFDGKTQDWRDVSGAFANVKYRPTPDAVAPPGPMK